MRRPRWIWPLRRPTGPQAPPTSADLGSEPPDELPLRPLTYLLLKDEVGGWLARLYKPRHEDVARLERERLLDLDRRLDVSAHQAPGIAGAHWQLRTALGLNPLGGDPGPLPLEPVTYLVRRVEGGNWLARLYGDPVRGRIEAHVDQLDLERRGVYAFAGQAESLEAAHWQLRHAMGLRGWTRANTRGELPWSGEPGPDSYQGLDAPLLVASMEYVGWHDDLFARHVYERLFRLANDGPEIQALFARTDMGRQEHKVAQILTTALSQVDNLEKLVLYLQTLGRKHAAYEVKPAHYEALRFTVLQVLAEFHPGWGPRLHNAWSAFIDVVSSRMLEGYPPPQHQDSPTPVEERPARWASPGGGSWGSR